MYAGSVRVFRSTSGGLPAGAGGWTAISGDLTTGTVVKATGDVITTMSLGSGTTAGTLLTGSRYGKVFRSANADSAAPTWTEITGNLPAFANVNDTGNPWIASVVLNPANGNEAWVALGAAGIGRIWHTLNASAGAGPQSHFGGGGSGHGGTIHPQPTGPGVGVGMFTSELRNRCVPRDPAYPTVATIFAGSARCTLTFHTWSRGSWMWTSQR